MKNIRLKPLPIKKILIASFLLLISIAILSITFGRELYGIEQTGLKEFALVNFAGYLFFLLMPVELAYLYLLDSVATIYPLFLITILTAFIAQNIDYFIGRAFSEKFIKNFIGENRYKRTRKYIENYGGITVFIFNLFPLSSPIVALVAGMLRYSYFKLGIYMLSGLFLKYLIITLFFH